MCLDYPENLAIPAVTFAGLRHPDSGLYQLKSSWYRRTHKYTYCIYMSTNATIHEVFFQFDTQPNIFERIANSLAAIWPELAGSNFTFSAMFFHVLLSVLPACWLSTCLSYSKAGHAPAQTTNLTLTRTLHRLLSQHAWSGLNFRFIAAVRYRVRHPAKKRWVLHTEYLTRFRRMRQTARSDTLVLRQIYRSVVCHVIVESLTTGPDDTDLYHRKTTHQPCMRLLTGPCALNRSALSLLTNLITEYQQSI
nr:hypothetical protein [uncultured Arsenicibacter sp.]